MRAGVLCRILAVVSALLLSACVTASTPGAGAWTIERRLDRISGQPTATAFVTTINTMYRAGPIFPAGLELMCFDSQPVVRLVFTRRVGSNRSAFVEYRFNDKPGRKADARFLPDYKTVVIEDKDAVAQFVDELRTSNVLFVRVNSLYAGRTTAEFRVHGAPLAIKAAFADCPVAAAEQPRRQRRT